MAVAARIRRWSQSPRLTPWACRSASRACSSVVIAVRVASISFMVSWPACVWSASIAACSPRVLPNLDQLGEALGSPLPGRGQRLQTRLLGGVVGGEPFQIAEQDRAAA